MKIIKATWENRNLGRDAYEITLDRKDLKNFDVALKEIYAQNFAGAYVVVKMPVGDLKALHTLEDDGFQFMETQFHIECNLQNYRISEVLERFQNMLKYEEVSKTKSEWQKIVDLITPDMFTTDRIYLDPKMSREISSIRYKNWIMDLVEKDDVNIGLSKCNDKLIGFDLYRYDKKEKSTYNLLGGVFSKYQLGVYGLLHMNAFYQYEKLKGIKINKTCISSNNLSVCKCYSSLGYTVCNTSYVLRKMFK